MNDLEISKALAISIGWSPEDMRLINGSIYIDYDHGFIRKFCYMEPSVIWPISEYYGAFPSKKLHGSDPKITWEKFMWDERSQKFTHYEADTAAKCVALAVIAQSK